MSYIGIPQDNSVDGQSLPSYEYSHTFGAYEDAYYCILYTHFISYLLSWPSPLRYRNHLPTPALWVRPLNNSRNRGAWHCSRTADAGRGALLPPPPPPPQPIQSFVTAHCAPPRTVVRVSSESLFRVLSSWPNPALGYIKPQACAPSTYYNIIIILPSRLIRKKNAIIRRYIIVCGTVYTHIIPVESRIVQDAWSVFFPIKI